MSDLAAPTDTGAPDAATDATDLLEDPAPDVTADELRAEVERLRGEVSRLRAGEEPVGPHEPITTGGHLLWVLGHVSAEMRQRLAGLLVRSTQTASVCAEADHERTISMLRQRTDAYAKTIEHSRTEADRLQRTGGPDARAVAMALTYALLPEVQQ
ncbi:hypothetical protein AB0G49_14280 [Streptomyces longwoodensis]|uniref:hypothetical protein n=1 Tax=Streptomyces longwoodensis TaxID=68231 RepID=UPI0033D08B06